MRLSDATLLLFTLVSSIRVVAYLPQIAQALRDTTGCKAISCTTWLLFLVSHVATVAYALVNLGDTAMALVFAANAAFCMAILGIVWWKRTFVVAPSSAMSVPHLRIVHAADLPPSIDTGLDWPTGDGQRTVVRLGRRVGKRRRRQGRGAKRAFPVSADEALPKRSMDHKRDTGDRQHDG